MKKLVQQNILYFQGFSATLFLHSRTICCHVFMKIGDGIAFHGKFRGVEGVARGIYGIDADGVVDEVFIETAGFDLVDGEVSRQLVDDGADHLEVTQFLGTGFGYKNDPRAVDSFGRKQLRRIR